MASTNTGIEWCESTWNPIRGCTRISPGCGGANHEGGCYAEKMAARFSGPGQPYEGFARRTKHGGQWTGKLALIPQALLIPLHWRKPRMIFVNSMSDLFHGSLSDADIDQVFAVMALCPQHIFQVLTKRSERMREYLAARNGMGNADLCHAINTIHADLGNRHGALQMPLPNVWLGVSVENQECADERIPHLLATPAAVRFLSCEPLLGPLDIAWALSHNSIKIAAGFLQLGHFSPGLETLRPLDWVIAGNESGPRRRPGDLAWMRSLRDQCAEADVPFFAKQDDKVKPLPADLVEWKQMPERAKYV